MARASAGKKKRKKKRKKTGIGGARSQSLQQRAIEVDVDWAVVQQVAQQGLREWCAVMGIPKVSVDRLVTEGYGSMHSFVSLADDAVSLAALGVIQTNDQHPEISVGAVDRAVVDDKGIAQEKNIRPSCEEVSAAMRLWFLLHNMSRAIEDFSYPEVSERYTQGPTGVASSVHETALFTGSLRLCSLWHASFTPHPNRTPSQRCLICPTITARHTHP